MVDTGVIELVTVLSVNALAGCEVEGEGRAGRVGGDMNLLGSA